MALKRKIKRYGWHRDLPDHRDKLYRVERIDEVQPIDKLPDSVDLRSKMPPVVDQGNLGSCTANAIAGNIGFVHPDHIASRLFIYYNERSIEGSVGSDSGAQLRDGIKSLVQWGDCDENVWPYIISRFRKKPSPNCYAMAKSDLLKQYLSINGIQEMKSCLAAGYPFVFGFTVYQSFESDDTAKTGIMTMPQQEDGVLGGHAVCAVGYDDTKKTFIVRNSWGTGWGDQGYFYMPYLYISDSNLCDDFWTIRD